MGQDVTVAAPPRAEAQRTSRNVLDWLEVAAHWATVAVAVFAFVALWLTWTQIKQDERAAAFERLKDERAAAFERLKEAERLAGLYLSEANQVELHIQKYSQTTNLPPLQQAERGQLRFAQRRTLRQLLDYLPDVSTKIDQDGKDQAMVRFRDDQRKVQNSDTQKKDGDEGNDKFWHLHEVLSLYANNDLDDPSHVDTRGQFLSRTRELLECALVKLRNDLPAK